MANDDKDNNNYAIDTYSMQKLYDLQDNFLPNKEDQYQILWFIREHLFSLVKTLTIEDFRELKAYESSSLVLKCCDKITNLQLDKINKKNKGE